jgi:hypothetical protein
MKRTILWTQTTTYASEVQVTIAQVARWAAASDLLRTNAPGQSQCHPSPAQVEKMMATNEQFNAFITTAYCQDLGLLRSIDATVQGTGAPTVKRRPK